MRQSLSGFFDKLKNSGNIPCDENVSEDLFRLKDDTLLLQRQYDEADLLFITGYYSGNIDFSRHDEYARFFYNTSADAFDILIHAWMSELPVEGELTAFARKVIAAADTAAKLTVNRSDPDTLAVLKAADKARYEIHRMQGLLRFSPDTDGVYTARCAPDHLVIPALGKYLTARFGDTAWAVIDEKRSLCLERNPPEPAEIFCFETNAAEETPRDDKWEKLWKHYHKTINNESRKNAGLQRQLMPKRYWKYLPEM